MRPKYPFEPPCLLIVCSALSQAQARVQFLQGNHVPMTTSLLGSVWHTIAFGAPTEADSLVGLSTLKLSRQLRSLCAASCVIWMTSDHANKSVLDSITSNSPYAAAHRWPVADGGASSSQAHQDLRPASSMEL